MISFIPPNVSLVFVYFQYFCSLDDLYVCFCCLNYINKWVPVCLAGLPLLVNHWSSFNYARQVTRTTKHKWSSGFMVLDVSYSRVLGQRPTFYCPLLAVSCPEVWARKYRHIYTVQSMYNVHTQKQNKNNNTTTGRWSHRWSHPTGYLSS